MTSELLSSIAGIVLSLVFSYVPGINSAFGALKSETKRLIMAGLLLIVAGSAFGLSCAGLWPTVTCDQDGALGLIGNLVAALIANQAAYSISPETKAVAQAKWLRDQDTTPVG